VYWHKTVRSCEAMFKRFFYEYVEKMAVKGKRAAQRNIAKLLDNSDDEFISSLLTWAKKENQIKLIKMIQPFAYGGRKLIYKPAYIYFEHNTNEPTPVNTFFRWLFDCSYKDLVTKSKELARSLREHIPEIDEHDILLERTPVKSEKEKYNLDGFRIYNTRKKTYDDHPSEIVALNRYLSENRQAYMFCHPDYYKKIREITQEPDTFASLLTGGPVKKAKISRKKKKKTKKKKA